ncbi:MAG: haloacid dehalogenase, partial [Anaerolineales bacterium]
MIDLNWVQGLIIDMDGVLWRGHTLLEGVPELFDHMRQRDLKFTLATNNATATPAKFAERLRSGRVEVSTENIVTSALATSSYLSEYYPDSANLLVIGDTGLRSALTDQGFTIVDSAEQAEAVVVGMDPTVN